jgi:DDE superfamily endonuclease
LDNVVGVVDGYLLQIATPNKKHVGNVRSYFSGHYQCYGVNCQAVADHKSRFIYFSVVGPGVMGDNDAIGQCSLKQLIDNLPFGFCVIGDAAYVPSEHLIPIYYGSNKKQPQYDNFNYYASQLRIRVEMAFGMMVRKWGYYGSL